MLATSISLSNQLDRVNLTWVVPYEYEINFEYLTSLQIYPNAIKIIRWYAKI